MTDGNLTTHIRILQEEGFISVAKSLPEQPVAHHLFASPRRGRKAFAGYIDLPRKNRPPEQALKII